MSDEFWYLGSPYSKYPDGILAAFEEVCRIAALFAKAGIPVYSPIAHTHPIALHGTLDPFDHDMWLPFDEPMLLAAKGLIICEMRGWQVSRGLFYEVERFKAMGKPIRYFDPGYPLFEGKLL